MASGRRRIAGVAGLVTAAVLASGCSRAALLEPEYEYEEEVYLSLDGSARVNVHASVAALVALRGAILDPDPRARLDRDYVRRFFGAPANRVSVSLARRDGRRLIHAGIQVDDLRQVSKLAPFAWSEYRLERRSDTFEYRQSVGAPAAPGRRLPPWTGQELVAFRFHLPSEVTFHNAPSGEIERGNILRWAQPLGERLDGRPVDIQMQFEATSILANTLLLFGATMVAALAAMAGVVWWIRRSGT
ncbi:MAG: hypothetical protein A3F70_11635 [Acidobacteria bacterium RIFCSPLOWO2_12_FULL_67_14]|nr:MAG: hypothetical protein A3F70_11635 [Acidobacteria bacterium RIFCSPLOWO2_12_FULL_67_14]